MCVSAYVLLAPGCDYLPGYVVNNRGEVGGSVETHGFEALVIGLHHPLDAAAVRILWVPVLHKHRQENTLKYANKNRQKHDKQPD